MKRFIVLALILILAWPAEAAKQLFANNMNTYLAADITDSATSMTINDATGFPTITGSDWFLLTLVASDGTKEIVKCTARIGTTLTIERAQEGSSASAFTATPSTIVSLRLTKGVLERYEAISEFISGDGTDLNLEGSITPDTDGAYDIGSDTYRVDQGFFDYVEVTNDLEIGSGSAAAPTLNDGGTDGIYFPVDQVGVSIGGTGQVVFSDGAILPVTDDDVDLGSGTYEFKDGYFDGTVYADAINYNGTTLTVNAAELNLLDGLSADYSELNQLDGVTVGGTSAGDIVTLDDTQTLTNKTLTSPTLTSPNMTSPSIGGTAITASAAELNQLDDVEVGGASSGDIVTIDDTQTLTNKTLTAPTINSPTLNGTKFSAYCSALQTISASSTETLVYWTELYDTNNEFSSNTFTVLTTGYYYISYNLDISSSAPARVKADILLNGSTSIMGCEAEYPGGQGVAAGGLYYLESGQTLVVRVRNRSSTYVIGVNPATVPSFSIFRVF